MPRRAKGPRLYLRERHGRESVWVILDRGREHGTGFGESQREEAEGALAEHLAKTRLKAVRKGDPSKVLISDVLMYYSENRAQNLRRHDVAASLMNFLLDHAGTSTCEAINGQWCRDYVTKRTTGVIAPPLQPGKKKLKLPKDTSVRRDLQHLSACLGFAVKEGILAYAPKLTYPGNAEARMRFLSRDEVAKLLWVCWRTKQHGPKNQILYPLRHLCRFILMGVYTGTRSSAILTASFFAGAERSWMDLDAGVFYRLAEGKQATNKLQPPVAVPDALMAHLRRWKPKTNTGWVVTFHGEPVLSVKTAFARACALAGLQGVTPHVLRHTFMTWVLTNGMPIHTAAKIAGMSVKLADSTYGHLDNTRRDGLNSAIRGRNMGGKRTSAAKIA